MTFVKRILIVDDDPLICELVSKAISAVDVEVTLTTSGRQALTFLKKQRFEMAILDIRMPEMDGLQLIRRIRTEGQTAFMPVMFLTGQGSKEDKLRGFHLGADDFMEKPFSLEELKLRVMRILKRTTPDASFMGQTVPIRIGFQGSLTDFGLASLLTLFSMENKSGHLHLSLNGACITFYLRGGQVVRAKQRDKSKASSYDCVYTALSWQGGSFHFVKEEVSESDELQLTTSQLLLDIAREMDERGDNH